jgi:hypothetical protein
VPKKKLVPSEQRTEIQTRFFLATKVGDGGITSEEKQTEEACLEALRKLQALRFGAPTWWRIFAIDPEGQTRDLERGGEEP